MQKTNRLVLVPEELYQSLLSAPPSDGTALGHVRAQMDTMAMEHRRRGGKMRDGPAVARYEQEWKRYNKLAREEAERPLNVQLKNVKELVDALPAAASASTAGAQPGGKESPQAETGEPPPRRKRQVPPVRATKIKRARVKPARKSEQQQEAQNLKSENPLAQAMHFINTHATALGITPQGQVLKAVGGTEVLKTSNVLNIIDHVRRNEGVRRHPLPVGYNEFVRRMGAFPALQRLLLEQTESSSPVGLDTNVSSSTASTKQSGSGMQMIQAKTYKKPETMPIANIAFRFKPTLWN